MIFDIEFCSGGDLFFHIQQQEKFSLEVAKFILIEVILAIECLHANDIIYRDLKPENILMDEKGHIRLADFGLSKLNFRASDYSYSFCGSPEYLSPEILVNEAKHNRMVDIYSLGCLFYEML